MKSECYITFFSILSSAGWPNRAPARANNALFSRYNKKPIPDQR